MFAAVAESIELFKTSGGCRLFKDVKKDIQESDEWVACVKVSDMLNEQVVKIIKASGRPFICALLSKPVRLCLTSAGIVLPEKQFQFTNHPSCLRGGAADESDDRSKCNKRTILISECRKLRIQAQVLRDGCTDEEATLLMDTAIECNHHDVRVFCETHGILPKPNSFRYCPYEVVVAVFNKMLEMGMHKDIVIGAIGSQLWHSVTLLL
jgi:hypothetical protein